MAPRGSEGLDFTPILTHYLFLFTTILAVVGWFVAFIGQIITTADFGHGAVGVLWFSIWLQLFLILGVLYTLASDSIGTHRFQLSVFGAVAIVFAVIGVNQGIFSGTGSLDAMAAGWLILAVVNILWVLYFTSEEDSLMLYIFNSLGTGGLTPPSRRRRARSVANMNNGVGYTSNYSSGAGIGHDMPYDSKIVGGPVGSGVRSNSFVGAGSLEGGAARSLGGGGSVNNAQSGGGPDSAGGGDGPGPTSPLIGSGNAGIGSGGGPNAPNDMSTGSEFTYKAKALYAYTASVDDPTELTFAKGDLLDIIDKGGKWWQAKKEDGTVGIAPSNYLQLI